MGDIIQERDDNVYTSASNIAVTRKVQGDTNNRFQQFPDGKMQWGSGSATPDVSLSRLSAGVLQVDTGTLQANIPIVAVTSSTVSLTAAVHGGAVTTLSRAAGITATLPAATGSGAFFRIANLTTVTSNNHIIQVANANDYMLGSAIIAADAGSTNNMFETANTGTTSTETDTITMDGSTKGGIKGDFIELIDVAANIWFVRMVGSATGTEASPFSAAV